MEVTVYCAVLQIDGEVQLSYFVSDGGGPDIEVGSASVAGAIARVCGIRNGIQSDMHAAEMWLRHGAVERRFTQVDQEEILDGDYRVQAFKEEDQDGNPDGEPLFVGFDGRGKAKTEATAHRIDALRDLQSYLQGRTF